MEKRIEKIRNILAENQAAVIISPANRFYLSGFESSDGIIVITEKTAVFMTDSRYIEKAKATVKSMDTRLLLSESQQINEILSAEKIKSVLVETDYLSVEKFENLKAKLSANIEKDQKLSAEILKMRAVKSQAELKLIKAAQELTDKTFSYILERITAGRTEREVMLDMEFFMRKEGSSGTAFDFIVVSGKNSSLPHGVPTGKKIEKGDFVTMDFGAVVGGYRSDMTRTVAVGNVSEKMKEAYSTVLKAQNAAINFAAAGKSCANADKTARDIIDSTRFNGSFGHALGHSVGIDIHETPTCSKNSKDVFTVGNIMTVEPGIYLENEFGLRIEDMIYITESGNQNLTASPKELIIL